MRALLIMLVVRAAQGRLRRCPNRTCHTDWYQRRLITGAEAGGWASGLSTDARSVVTATNPSPSALPVAHDVVHGTAMVLKLPAGASPRHDRPAAPNHHS